MSLFPGKDLSTTIRGNCTEHGNRKFEASRAALGKLARRPAYAVSDGDTVEYLARLAAGEDMDAYFVQHPPDPWVPTKDGKNICARCKKRPKAVDKSRCLECLAYAAKMQQKYDKAKSAAS